MGFKLVIECTKDIEKLHIDFKDGTTVVQESTITSNQSQTFLNTDDDESTSISSEIIQKPFIEDIERPAKVAQELQELDI